ncbi:hypothetical protein UFOVP328_299 [uncultured Caudovirales phage]|uniref:Capsule polysaccharide biosynthesis protein n=1 Tax=uncultured Caudovirales phage TaxID=2100421 RepID=A0A6J5LZ05_9CAUD|nr:hypothetical protein UFOVP328_299 [uncultured Caudovirales phage]
MRVSIFDQYGALNSAPVFAAIRAGLEQIGIEYTSMDSSADVAVIWSLLWAGRMKPNQQIWDLFQSQGKPVIVAEVGMLRRGFTWKLSRVDRGVPYYGQELVPNRASQLGLDLKPWTNSGYNIVVACQRSDSEQWSGQPPTAAWLTETSKMIRRYTDKPIVIRPHPRQRITDIPGCVIESPQPIPGTYDSFDYNQCLRNAWAVINHNSGPGSQAILNGVPAFVGSSSLAAPVANLDLSQIENPLRPDRTQWIEKIAHTEWTTEEIQTGFPLQRLLLT